MEGARGKVNLPLLTEGVGGWFKSFHQKNKQSLPLPNGGARGDVKSPPPDGGGWGVVQ